MNYLEFGNIFCLKSLTQNQTKLGCYVKLGIHNQTKPTCLRHSATV